MKSWLKIIAIILWLTIAALFAQGFVRMLMETSR